MVKNRTTQLIYLTSYCVLGIVAALASFGLFQAEYENYFYVYYTHISNYLCTAIMIKELVGVIKNKNNGYIKLNLSLKFMCVVMILMTGLIYNILLIDYRTLEQNLSIGSILSHIILPFMFILDYFLFFQRNKTKWYYPFMGLIIPLLYTIYIYLRSFIVKGKVSIVYPYFFMHPAIGVCNVVLWMIGLAVAFIVAGYMFYFLDKIKKQTR